MTHRSSTAFSGAAPHAEALGVNPPGSAAAPDATPRPSWRPAVLVLIGIGLTSAGHYLTPPHYLLWHGIFQRLYYLPVVYAAVAYGAPGGLAAAALSGLLYIPHIVMTWSHMSHFAMEQYAEIFLFFAVGTLTGVLSTRERRRALELQRTAQELRTVYQELQSSFEQLRRADRLSAIGQLASGLAHEIRNPLAGIDGAAEVLQANPPLDIRNETIAIVRKECSRLNRLLTGLLDFARPRSPQLHSVEVDRVLQSVVHLLQHSAHRNVEFRITPPPHQVHVLCDEEQLSQVVLNLALNAAQAMPEGGTVQLSAGEVGGQVRIDIADQGPGIPEAMADKIFDPFFTTKASGTGLGLSVVHQIVTQHQGVVEVGKNTPQGTIFRVTLPAGQELPA